MEHELILAGCTPTPLAHYLKALGVFRLVAEQLDPDVRACWRKDTLVLLTKASQNELEQFFLEDYSPTPVLAPWNGGSGFYENDNKDGFTPLSQSKAIRFEPFRTGIAVAQQSLARLNLRDKPDGDIKPQLLELLRAESDDNMLTWLDAAVVLTSGSPSYPPLLGTGGNDGRLDFTNNFMQRLVELFDPETGHAHPENASWLTNALFGNHTPGFVQKAIGQFSPGQIGGANGTSGFSCDSRINPWDFILTLEGAVLFATATTRRLGSDRQAALSYPFTVYQANVGSGGMAQSDSISGRSRGEIWLPLWPKPSDLRELRWLLSEGRATLGRHAARDGLDFARAVSQLGVDRGISEFQRYGFMVRNGLAYLATPLGRIETRRSPAADLIVDLEGGRFLETLRRAARDKDATLSLKRSASQLENAIFDLTHPSAGRRAIQQCLIRLGEVIQVLASSHKAHTEIPTLPSLSPHWITQSDDGSAEFRLALALSGLHGLPAQLAPVAREKGHRHWSWNRDSRSFVWGSGDPVRNLAHVVERRLLETQREGYDPFSAFGRTSASLAHVDDFLAGRTDDARLAGLLLGLIWTHPPEEGLPTPAHATSPLLPAAYTVLKPFFTSARTLNHLERLPEGCTLPLPGDYTRLLLAGRIDQAIARAWQRGRVAGLNWPAGAEPVSARIDGPRLLAALAIPLTSRGLLQLLPRAADSEATTA